MPEVTLSSPKLSATFDSVTGCLVALQSKQTGLEIKVPLALAENWRLSIPLPHDWAHMVFGRANKVSIVQDKPDTATFVWDGVEIESKPYPIRLSAHIRVVDDEIQSQMTIDNQSPYAVDYLWYPILAGFRQLYSGEADELCVPKSTEIQHDIYNQEWFDFINRYYYHCREIKMYGYPTELEMQWVDLYNSTGRGGLYATSLDNERFCSYFAFEHERAGTPMTLAIVKAPFVKPAETETVPANVLSLHEGDWHGGARKYREWMRPWFKRKERADWVRELDGWLAFQGHAADHHIVVSYDEYPSWLEKAKSVGLNAIHVHCGVHEGGIEGGYPYWNRWHERMGGRKALVAAVDKIHELGGHIITFAKENKVNTGLPEYFSMFCQHAIKLRDGSSPVVNYPIGAIDMDSGMAVLANMCRAHEKWHDFIVPILEDLAKTGLDGMMLDEWCSGLNFCFDRNHTHQKPSDQWAGQLALGRKIAAAWNRHNPEHLLSGEEIWDAAYEFMDLSFARGGAHKYNEIYRYALPWIQRTTEIYQNEYDNLNHAFACGFIFALCFDYYLGGPEAYPEFAAYMREIVRIRSEVRNYFLDGEFLDTLVHRLEASKGICARTYQYGGRDLVVVYNRNTESGEFALTLDRVPAEWSIREPGKDNRKEKGKRIYEGVLAGHRLAVLEF